MRLVVGNLWARVPLAIICHYNTATVAKVAAEQNGQREIEPTHPFKKKKKEPCILSLLS